MITVMLVALISLVVTIPMSLLIVEVTTRIDRRIRKRVTAAVPVRDAIRAELDQTLAWWDRQFDTLVKKQIPRDWASHEGHDLADPITFYASGYEMHRYCIDCGVTVERPPDG